MTAKELVLAEAPTWSEEQAERALQAARVEDAQPGDIIDDWGNLSAMKRHSASRLMKRLSEEEIAANGETLAEAWGYEPKRTR